MSGFDWKNNGFSDEMFGGQQENRSRIYALAVTPILTGEITLRFRPGWAGSALYIAR